MGDAKAFLAALGAFLGANGLGQLVYWQIVTARKKSQESGA